MNADNDSSDTDDDIQMKGKAPPKYNVTLVLLVFSKKSKFANLFDFARHVTHSRRRTLVFRAQNVFYLVGKVIIRRVSHRLPKVKYTTDSTHVFCRHVTVFG